MINLFSAGPIFLPSRCDRSGDGQKTLGTGDRLCGVGSSSGCRIRRLAFLAPDSAFRNCFGQRDHQYRDHRERNALRRREIPRRGEKRQRPADDLDEEHRHQYRYTNIGAVQQLLYWADLFA